VSIEINPVSESFRQTPSLNRGVPVPFFFGAGDGQLFGCYHGAQSGHARNWGVVLCYPIGHEHILAHRAYRLLAQRLSMIGFHTLRFDYFGSGDSAGDAGEGSISRWSSDVASAIEEIRRRCGLEKVCLIGCRLGATLALTVGAVRRDVDAMVLWDPIISGNDYLHHLQNMHKRMLLYSKVIQTCKASDRREQILGFPLNEILRADLKKLALQDIQQQLSKPILIVDDKEEPSSKQLMKHLESAGAQLNHQTIPYMMDWGRDTVKIFVPVQILQCITDWLEKVCP
jgi:uncharacterized protein